MEIGKEYRIGNFVITKNESSDLDFINIMTVSGLWTLSLNMNVAMAAFIEMEIDANEPNELAGLNMFLVNFFCITTMYDVQLQKKVTDVIAEFVNNIKAEPIEGEDADLNGMKTLSEMKKEAKTVTAGKKKKSAKKSENKDKE